MGKRSRKRASSTATTARPTPPARPERTSRSEAKNAAVRAQLEPLAEGERPLAVTIGAFVTIGLVVANIVAYIVGVEVQGDRPAFIGFLAFSALMVTMAWGLWRAKYWAVLGLESLLGLLIVIIGLVGLLSSSLTDILICLGILIPSGALFWFLIRAMARIQMPQRPR